MKIAAEFVTSASTAADFPHEGCAEIGLVGRSNVGKSSLINALVRRRVARTSRAPGKTRLANVYRVVRGTAAPIYLVDLPGYGFARGGSSDFEDLGDSVLGHLGAALLLVDARHPGMDADRAAWRWLVATVSAAAVIGTKIDKLSRAERARALTKLDSVFEAPVLPVSAVTGEGLDELWKLIDKLANNNKKPDRLNRLRNLSRARGDNRVNQARGGSNSPPRSREETAPPRPRESSASTWRR